MEKSKEKEVSGYSDDAMARSTCLICGERVGEYRYRGKPVCPVCLDDIRSNH